MGRGEQSVSRVPIIIPLLGDPESVTADERDEHLMLLEAARQHLNIEWTRTLAVADSAGDHDLMGYPSTIAYLKHRFGMAGGRAHRYVRRARAALIHRATFAAWRHRQVSSDQADLLFKAADSAPEEYRQSESALIEIVGSDYDETKQVLDYWRNDVDSSSVRRDLEEQLARRHLNITRRLNGMIAGDFALPTLAGETLLSAIEALMPPPAETDMRSADQRRADALEDLARCYLDDSRSHGLFGGEKPHLNVHVDLAALQGESGVIHETEDGVVLNTETIGQIACDSSVSRIVFSPQSEVLDVGRKTRVIPAALRRAVVARDRHCTWAGCTRSSRWCDVHHIVSWAEGGLTTIGNLRLLCRYHHTLTHLEMSPGDEISATPLIGTGRRRSS